MVPNERFTTFPSHRHRLHVSIKLHLNLIQAETFFTFSRCQSRFISTRSAAVIEHDLRAHNDTSELYVELKLFHRLRNKLQLNNVVSDKPHELYSAFSIYKNGAKLFDVRRVKSVNVLQCLSGLRTFAMLHIMLGHRFSWSRGFPNVNSNVFAPDGKWNKTLFSAIVAVHPIAVDSFFVMGGLLLTRSALHNIEK